MNEPQEIEPEILPGVTMEELLLLSDEQFTRLREQLTLPDGWSDKIFEQLSLAITELLCGGISTACLLLFLPVISLKSLRLNQQAELLCQKGQKILLDLDPTEIKDCSASLPKDCYCLLGVNCFPPTDNLANKRWSPLNAAELLAFCLHSDQRIWKDGARLLAAGSRSDTNEHQALAISRQNDLIRIHWQTLDDSLSDYLLPACQKRN